MALYDLSSQHKPESAADELAALAASASAAGYAFDTYGKGSSLQAFETELAELLGKPAAVFFATGTAAQQAVLYAHTRSADAANNNNNAPSLVLLHGTSHLVYLDCLRDATAQVDDFDQLAKEHLPDFDVVSYCRVPHALSTEDFARLPTCEDVERALRAGRHARGRRPAVVVLELPQRMNGGATPSLDELRRISALCRERAVRLHCDGARLWEVQPFYGVPLRELAALFDSVYVSFYKGIGAVAGAALLGEAPAIAAARRWQKRRGGDVFSRGPLALSSEVQWRAAVLRQPARRGATAAASLPHLRAHFSSSPPLPLSFAARFARLQQCVGLVKAIAAVYATSHGPDEPPLLFFDPPEPQSCLVHVYLRGEPAALEQCHDAARALTGVRLWNSLRGRGHAALAPMAVAMAVASAEAACARKEAWSYFEWSMGSHNGSVPDEAVEAGWRAFFEARTSSKSD